MKLTLIDTGPIVAYYDAADGWHSKARVYFEKFRGQFATTCPVITESMFLLRSNPLIQNVLLEHISKGLYEVISLEPVDYTRIAQLNYQYKNLQSDFADLSLVAIAERFDLSDIASLDGDFDIYRTSKAKSFNRVFPKPSR